MATPNLDLPTSPNGATNISVAYNEAMQTLDGLVQLGIEGVLTAPPAITVPADLGKLWRIGTPATGAWAGKENQIALCTGDDLFVYFLPGTQVKYLLDKSDGGLYKYASGVWGLAAGLGDAPSNGTTYGRKDGAWVAVGGVVAASAVTYSNATSGLAATNVQAAIDEVVAIVDANATRPVTTLAPVAGVVTYDLSLGSNFIVNLTANVTSQVITNTPGAGFAAELDVDYVQDGTGGRTVAMPASFKALGGSDVVVASAIGAVTVLNAKSKDNGTTWRYAMQESA